MVVESLPSMVTCRSLEVSVISHSCIYSWVTVTLAVTTVTVSCSWLVSDECGRLPAPAVMAQCGKGTKQNTRSSRSSRLSV
jgi:hypothetical protein